MKGVRIVLEKGTRVPKWIRVQDERVSRGGAFQGDRTLPTLTIEGGEASFIPGGGVEVKMPGASKFWTAFPPRTVHEIHDLESGRIIKRNKLLCPQCGFILGIQTGTPDTPQEPAPFGCESCRHEWEQIA